MPHHWWKKWTLWRSGYTPWYYDLDMSCPLGAFTGIWQNLEITTALKAIFMQSRALKLVKKISTQTALKVTCPCFGNEGRGGKDQKGLPEWTYKIPPFGAVSMCLLLTILIGKSKEQMLRVGGEHTNNYRKCTFWQLWLSFSCCKGHRLPAAGMLQNEQSQ